MRNFKAICAAAVLATGYQTGLAGVVMDDFSAGHDYSGGDVSGTIFDGVLNPGSATILNANHSNAGQLTAALAPNVGFDSSLSNAPLLYFNVSGDFDAKVSIAGSQINDYLNGGIIAYQDAANFVSINHNTFATASTFGPGNTSTYNDLRSVLGGAQLDNNASVAAVADTYLELVRSGTSFTALTSADGIAYTQVATLNTVALDTSLKLGLYYANYSSNSGAEQFADFSVSGPSVPEPGMLGLAGLSASMLMTRRSRRGSELR